MDAIEYLTDQHFEIASLFDQIETAARTNIKRRLRRKLVDLLAVHTALEETIFFPAVKEAGAQELLLTALVEHLSAESIVAELVRLDVNDEAAAKMSALKERKKQHADAEEKQLFPRIRELLTRDELELLGLRMFEFAERLMGPGVGARERLPARALA